MKTTAPILLIFACAPFLPEAQAVNPPPGGGYPGANTAEGQNALLSLGKEGKPYSVRYDQVNAMLLNEFLKEHKIVEQQQVTISELRSAVARQRKDFEAAAAKQEEQIKALNAGLRKVSAQIQVSTSVEGPRQQGRRATRVVLNSP
jgi:hypothetical protein